MNSCSHATWKVQFNVLGYIFILTQLPFILHMYNMTKEFPVLILSPSRYQHFVLLQFKKLETSESSIYYTFILDYCLPEMLDLTYPFDISK